MCVFLSLIAERCKTINALYATCMERLIETALLNEIRTVSKGKVFLIVSSGASVHSAGHSASVYQDLATY